MTSPKPTVSPGKTSVTPKALEQMKLIQHNDFTLEDLVLRLSISGKECHGFTYALGWTEASADDQVEVLPDQIPLHRDAFTAFYTQNIKIDYQEQDEEAGFIIENLDQKKFQGKFWKGHQELEPDLPTALQ